MKKAAPGPQQFMGCDKCKHRWPICRLPIEPGRLGRMLEHAICPNCNTTAANLRMMPVEKAE